MPLYPHTPISRYPDIPISRYPYILISLYPYILISPYPCTPITPSPFTPKSLYPHISMSLYPHIPTSLFPYIPVSLYLASQKCPLSVATERIGGYPLARATEARQRTARARAASAVCFVRCVVATTPIGRAWTLRGGCTLIKLAIRVAIDRNLSTGARSSWRRCTCDDDKRPIKRRKDNKGRLRMRRNLAQCASVVLR